MENLIIALFFWIIVKHFVCDFLLQSTKMVVEKSEYLAMGGIYHSLIHAVGTFAILYYTFLSFDKQIWMFLLISLAILDFITHYHIDWAKMNLGKVFNLTPNDKVFWILLGLDQTLHLLTYVLIIKIAIS